MEILCNLLFQYAIKKLLSPAFDTFSNNSKIIEELRKLLQHKTGLKQALDNALANMYKEKHKEYENFYCRFLDVEIFILLTDTDGNILQLDKQNTIRQVEESEFYKMIASIPG